VYWLVLDCYVFGSLCSHTHFGPDQVFSCHARYLRRWRALSWEQLMGHLRASYTSMHVDGKVYPLEASVVEVWVLKHGQ